MSPQKNKVKGRDLIRVAALSSDIKDTLKAIDNLLILTKPKKKKMEIYNRTTGKTDYLSIIDRKTGLDWTNDLIGNYGDLHYNDINERYEGDQNYIDWWQNIIDGLNEIEDLKEQAKEILNYDNYEVLERTLEDEGNGNDLEYHVSRLTQILIEVIKNKTL